LKKMDTTHNNMVTMAAKVISKVTPSSYIQLTKAAMSIKKPLQSNSRPIRWMIILEFKAIL
ncbi:MAG: hypothetical protein ACKVJF_14795, partial [Flavobacteriales bacterium]